MEKVTAYRCQYCGKVYLRECACKKHEEMRCSQNPEIRPLCYSCQHYESSFDENEKESIEYWQSYGWDGSEYSYTKLFSPNRCKHPKKQCKLFNNVKLSAEMREGLSEAKYEPMPNRRSGGCGYYDAIPEHPYATKL
ncbi:MULTISPECIES: hypothetical protein [Muribaculaceae]|uniref:C2H2-type domain-containing protein n=2 Tax=Muribaculaceae TaxID=2005473 RepID=A0A4Z0V1T2_9BACT|nr:MULTISPECIES: hypothetical protein [Muribaculaceae]QCD37188.1 hypothetical protein E7746_14715 [Muribaculum gordoncarteri]TGG35113.1 hypothetical protein EZ315_15630 [Duncaniella freteri]